MIAIACDHAAYELKEEIKKLLEKRGLSYMDFGTNSSESCHYPVYGLRAAQAVADGRCDRGIVMCGTGIGISLAANKVKGIRCALCCDVYSAQMTRAHNDANMLSMGARVLDKDTAIKIAEAFLDTPFEGGRHQARVDMLTAIENGESLE